jgi:hypothetical protein
VQLPDGQDRSAQINGARAAPLLSAARCLTSVGPPPVISFFLPPFPCCRVSSTYLSSLVRVLSFLSTIRSFPATRPVSFHISFSPEGESIFSRLHPVYLTVFRHESSPVTPLCHHSHFSPSLLPYTMSSPPRWPSCPSLKLFGCSRWQREKYSLSRDAELAGPLSIPRSSY